MRSHARTLFAVSVLFALLLAPVQAQAAKTTIASFGDSTTGATAGLFNTPRGIAVNQSGAGGVAQGTTYVVDSTNFRIQRFNPNGAFHSAWGWAVRDGGEEFQKCTVASGCQVGKAGNNAGQLGGNVLGGGAQGIAVDQTTGTLYVSDQNQRRINVFSATGAFIAGFGWGILNGSASFQYCTTICSAPNTTAPTGGEAGKFGTAIGGLAFNAGNLYVADKSNRRVDVFKPILAGVEFVRAFGKDVSTAAGVGFEVCAGADCKQGVATTTEAGGFNTTNSPADVAVDSEGNLFALDFGNRRVQKFDTTPAPVATEFGKPALDTVFGTGNLDSIAIDRSTDHVFVAGRRSAEANRIAVQELDETGAAVETHGAELVPTSANGLTVAEAPAGGNIYVSSGNAGHRVYVLNDTTPSIAAADAIAAHSATLHGQVVSNDVAVEYRFEVSADGATWTKLPASDATVPASPGAVAVEQPTGNILHASTQYTFRLLSTRPAGGMTLVSPLAKFTTLGAPPAVDPSGTADAVSSTRARLEGSINPEGEPTSYQFQYLTQAAYEANGDSFSGPTLPQGMPASPAGIGSGTGEVTVAEQLSGLAPDTAYRFRLLATNDTGTATGGEGAFTTHSPGFEPGSCPNDQFRTGLGGQLPECRAFEQASPVEKLGNYAFGTVYSAHAADDGQAVSFMIAGTIPGGDGAQNLGTYLARRGDGEWSTQGMLPPASAGKIANVTAWTPDFASVFSVAGDGTLGNGFFSRSTLDGSLSTVVPYVAGNPSFGFAGAAADGSRAFFQTISTLPLAAGQPAPAPGKQNVYVWNRGTGELYLAGVLPNGSVPAEGTLPGATGATEYLQERRAVSADGESVYFTDAATGQLYLRQHAGEPEEAGTVHVSASQKTNGSGPSGTDPGGPLPAGFLAGSDSGKIGLFTSSEELTDDAHTVAIPHVISSANISDGGEMSPSLLSLTAGAAAIAVDGEHIYWTDPVADTIGRADLDGGNPEPAFITGAHNPHGVALGVGADANHIYWTNRADDVVGNGTIGRANLSVAGCAPAAPPCEIDQAFVTGVSSPRGIDASATHLYWANQSLDNEPDRTIGRADVDGSNVNQAFITGAPGRGLDVAVDTAHNHIYVGRGPGQIACLKLSDGGIAPDCGNEFGFLPVSVPGVNEIAIDANHLYGTRPSTNTIVRADLGGANPQTAFIASAPSASGIAVDSSRIYWGANPSGRGADLYRFDAGSGQLADLTPDHSSLLGADVVGALGASADGSYAYYVANGVPDGVQNSPNANGETAAPGSCTHGFTPAPTGVCNLYVTHHSGGTTTTTFVARLDASGGPNGDAANWVPSRLAFGPVGTVKFQKTAQVTPDGRAIVFRSQRNLTAYDNGPESAIYRFAVGEAGPACVSCNPTGAAPAGTPTLGSINLPGVVTAPTPVLSRNISADGGRVFFESPDALLGADTDAAGGCPKVGTSRQQFPICQDVYEWQANGVDGCEQAAGCLRLLSDGAEPEPAFFLDASLSGDDAFIVTRARLVGQDTDDLYDVYDARVGGGLASQNTVAGDACDGDGCRPPALPVPAPPALGSSSFAGPGDERPRRAKRRNQRKKRAGKGRAKRGKKGSKHRQRAGARAGRHQGNFDGGRAGR